VLASATAILVVFVAVVAVAALPPIDKLATAVVLDTVNGAVPVATVEVITPDAEIVVNAPVVGVVTPTVPLILIDAVPVRLVTIPLEGVPKAPPTEYLLLKVVQSVELNAPRFVADAVGTFKVITGVVVFVATLEFKSVPVVPKVKAATLVTVPKLPVRAIPLALKTPVEGTKLNFVELVVAGLLPVVVTDKTG